MAYVEYCPCGRKLHYETPELEQYVKRLIMEKGRLIPVTTPEGTWKVPRHYIALHTIRAKDLPMLAYTYGWERIKPKSDDPITGQ